LKTVEFVAKAISLSFRAERGIYHGADCIGAPEDFSPRSLVSFAYLVEMTKMVIEEPLQQVPVSSLAIPFEDFLL